MKVSDGSRRFRRATASTLAGVVTLLATAVSFAAEPSATPAARQRYLAGAAAYSQGRYSDAIDQFLAADRVAPSSALSYDIARAYEKLGDPSLALRWYRDYLYRAGDPPDGATIRLTVVALQKQLMTRGVQQITVRSTPRGATVALDGEPTGVTPWTTDLPPGRHILTVTHDGYEKSERAFILSPDTALDIDVKLTATPPAVPATPPAAPLTPRTVRRQTRPVTPTPAPENGTPALRTLGLIGMGAGGLALGGALTFEILRSSAVDDAKKDPTQLGYATKLSTAKDQQTAARVLLGVGAGLAVTGGVLFLIGGPARGHGTELALGCSSVSCGARASGRF